jgi:hypothetical protein
MDKLEKLMSSVAAIGGIGLGLWWGSVYSSNTTTLLGYFLIFICAIILSILSYKHNKKIKKK